MDWTRRTALVTAAVTLTSVGGIAAGGAALAAPRASHTVPAPRPTWLSEAGDGQVRLPLLLKVLGWRHGRPVLAAQAPPQGLGPPALAKAYGLSGMSPDSNAGDGQTIAIVDAFHDPGALSDLNTFGKQYGYPLVKACTSLSQAGPCFAQADPEGTPKVNPAWVAEESLDIEYAHAEAPGAKLVLVEAKNAAPKPLNEAVTYARTKVKANEVSMSWGSPDFTGETADDTMFRTSVLYTAASMDSGHGAYYPADSPHVIGVGGTVLDDGAHVTEAAWGLSGGGVSANETLPTYQSSYTGPVHGASTVAALTSGMRGDPDVSFDAGAAVAVYDSTPQGQVPGGWRLAAGTSVGAPNWAGILAAGAAAGKTALQGLTAIYDGGYETNLRDITSGGNGTCGTDCTAGKGYDLITGLGSPVNYP